MLFEELHEIIDLTPHDAALNMAIDEALLHEATIPILRWYRWIRPSVSFGYFGRFESVAAAWPAHDLVRRWTGGGVVSHDEDITYSLIVPGACAFSRLHARDSYRMIHERIAFHLSRSGRPVRVAGESGAKVSDACFENPVAFDLLEDGSKIAGAAQRRSKSGLLHQGSIKSNGLDRSCCEGLASAFAGRPVQHDLPAAVIEKARMLATQKYATAAWLKKF